MEQKLGFLTALADFSFSEFVTTKIIKILYGLALFFAVLGALCFVMNGWRTSVLMFILSLIVAPILLLLYAIIIRVCLETVIVIFRIAEHAAAIEKQTRKEPQQS